MTENDTEERRHLIRELEETEEECKIAEAEVLAHSSSKFTKKTSEVLMPTLSGTGPPKYKERSGKDVKIKKCNNLKFKYRR